MQSLVSLSDVASKADDRVAQSGGQPALTGDEYAAAHGERLGQTLDLDTWWPGADLVEMYARLEAEVAEAVRQENDYQKRVRQVIFPLLRTRTDAPKGAGVFRVTPKSLEEIHRKLLFNGAVEACDGIVVSHDTLPVTITQIGICLVSYQGDQGTWAQRIFRRDLRTASTKNPVDEIMDLLDRRRERGDQDQENPRDRLSNLARRGIMAYAERAVLLDRSEAPWRMGHGNPTPYELVTGSGMPDLLREGLNLMKRLVLDHRRFVYVPRTTRARELLTIGNALNPLEYAIIDTNEPMLKRIASGHYRGQEWGPLGAAFNEFIKECGAKVVTGMYRASALAPAQMFYAHVDHAHEAALIALADSVLQEHRGFPLLIDLADSLCSATFGADVFTASTHLAYAAAGEPYRYAGTAKGRG
jgi:hypothetical protein